MTRNLGIAAIGLLACSIAAGCDDHPDADADADIDADADADSDADADDDGDVDAPPGPSRAVFDLSADVARPEQFYDLPVPSDLRLTAEGAPDLTGFPRPRGAGILDGLLEIAAQRSGHPTVPVAYFRFDGPLAPRAALDVIAAEPGSPALLVDVDPGSPERGRLIPVVAATPGSDDYLPEHVLALAARPGFVLHPSRTYAFVVRAGLGDALGRPLEPAEAIAQLAAGEAPAGPRGAAARDLYAPLFETLRALAIDPAQVVSATVFTTGDVVADTAALGDLVLARPALAATIEELELAADDTPASHPRFCELVGRVSLPQFQRGVPPFDTEGLFELDAEGAPVAVTYPTLPDYGRVPFTITLPRGPMPEAGFPLVLYLHSSGGTSHAAVDRGTWAPASPTHPCPEGTDEWEGVAGCNTLGEGPSHVLAARGFAVAGSALPVNPERLPGAGEIEYINFNNLKAFRDTFRQGVLEQRLFLRALAELRIPAGTVAACTGATLPDGVTEARLDTSRLVAMGQSMGGMYANLISATEPTIRAAIPTGAGGYWAYFILQTQLIPGAADLLGLVLATEEPLTFMHPALALLETAWEAADPIAYLPRLARRPLAGHPARPIYEAVGEGDSYFPTIVYDAVALAYGHPQAGEALWPTMQGALALAGLDGLRPYPLEDNLTSDSGTAYTGAVIQYEGDGVYDPHALYSQLEAVKYQYSCFAQSFVASGTARIADPTGRAHTDPCD